MVYSKFDHKSFHFQRVNINKSESKDTLKKYMFEKCLKEKYWKNSKKIKKWKLLKIMKMMQSPICSSPELIDPRFSQLRLPASSSS